MAQEANEKYGFPDRWKTDPKSPTIPLAFDSHNANATVNVQFTREMEDLLRKTNEELHETNDKLRNCRKDHSRLRNQVTDVLADNQRLVAELEKYKSAMGGGDYQEMREKFQLTSDALEKSRLQVDELRRERRSLQAMQECSQRTIENMEQELKNYRILLADPAKGEKIAHSYMRAVKMLKAKVSAQQEELRTQAETIKVLHDHKQRGGEHLQQLQHQLQEQAEQHSKKDSLQKQVLDYERSLAQSHNLLVESRRRESTAMRKIQEAISISEEATRERDEAKTRCESYKEELTQLASNIGSIMDEAASRTDNEVAKLRSKLGEKDKLIADIKEKFKRDSEKHKSVVHHLETRNNQLEQKWKEANKQIDRLEAELEATTRRLMDVEKSFNGGEENRDCKAKKHHDLEVERYFMTQKQIKKYHQDAMDDITRKFEAEIYRLSKHNSELQAANHLLRSGAAGDCIGLRV